MARNSRKERWARTIVLCRGLFVIQAVLVVLAEASPTFTDFRFTAEPADTVALRAQSAMLNCNAQYAGSTPDMQWIRDGVYMNFEGDTRRSKLKNGSLYFSQIIHSRSHRPDEGIYQCVASVNNLGTIVSRKAKLQVAYLSKSFSEEPKSLQVHLGDTAVFACKIEGSPTPTVTWYKEEQEIKEEGNINYRIHQDGVLEISDVQFSDFGRYKCKVENLERSRISSFATLSQDDNMSTYQGVAPRFVRTPKDQVALNGTTVMLYCVSNGRDSKGHAPRITWLKDGVTIDMADLDSRFSVVGKGSLRIENVKQEDAGSYTCRATNLEDSVDVDATLTVHVAPYFKKQPQNTFAHTNADVTFECDVIGSPKPAIQWRKNGDIVIPSDYFQIIDGRNLRILGLVNSDDGLYQCFAQNEVGNVQASAQLIILKPGTVEFASTELPSSPKNLIAAIVSTRFITLSWRMPTQQGSSEIQAYSVYWREQGSQRERVMNTTTPEANIQHLKPATNYEFRVLAYNKRGPGQEAKITVKTQAEVHVPGSASNLKAQAVSPTSIHITWQAPTTTNGVITNYKLYWYEVGAKKESSVDVQDMKYTLTGLVPFTEYSFRVVTFNSNGPGMSTEEYVARTYSDAPTEPPQNVTLETASSTSIIVRWEPPTRESQNGIITGYKIRYRRPGARGHTITTDGNRRAYALTDLLKATQYSVRITALSVNGTSPNTEWLSGETFVHDLDETRVPGMPSSLKVRPMTNSIIVSWTPPRETDIMIRGYILGYGKGIPDVYKQVVDAKQRYFTIRNLKPSSNYVISLRASNNVGEGRPIYETVITREATTPEPVTPMIPPVGLKAIVLSATTIVVTWSDTTLGRNQRITDNRYYTIRYAPRPTARRFKSVNSTDLNVHIDDLRPNTEYEFSVKVIKGQRKSTWSLSVFNRTFEASPATAPRDLTPVPVEGKPSSIQLNWQPPRLPNGQVTGYWVFYTTDATEKDRDWAGKDVMGDRLMTTIEALTPDTTYYFKVQARNSKGYGPMSPTAIFRTPRADGTGGGKIETPFYNTRSPGGDVWSDKKESSETRENSGGSGGTISTNTLWIIIACVVGITFIAIVAVTGLVVKRKIAENAERKKRKAGYKTPGKNKGVKGGPKEMKPPDLWIHHDHMELKSMKGQSDDQSGSQRDSEEVKSLDDSAGDHESHHEDDRYGRLVRPKPIMIPVDAQPPPREPVATVTAIPNGHLLGSEQTPVRPVYPRTQYNTQYTSTPRVHADDLQQPSSVKPQQQQPPSPYKKPTPPNTTTTTPVKPRSPLPVVTPRAPDVTIKGGKEESDLPKSYSAEELSAEMANLEGLMKDLNAITQQEFEC